MDSGFDERSLLHEASTEDASGAFWAASPSLKLVRSLRFLRWEPDGDGGEAHDVKAPRFAIEAALLPASTLGAAADAGDPLKAASLLEDMLSLDGANALAQHLESLDVLAPLLRR